MTGSRTGRNRHANAPGQRHLGQHSKCPECGYNTRNVYEIPWAVSEPPRQDGRPTMELRCWTCGYVGPTSKEPPDES